MKIKTVSYEELVSGEGYSNKRIGAVCEVTENESPEDALANLIYWVKQEFVKIEMYNREAAAIGNIIYERQKVLDNLLRDIEQMRNRWKTAEEFLRKHGVEVPEADIPF